MSMSGFIRGGLSVLVALLGLYILENTFGSSMDEMYLQFHAILFSIPLGPGWQNVGILTLGNWVWFDKAFVVAVIAVFVWWASLIFIDVDYSRTQRRG